MKKIYNKIGFIGIALTGLMAGGCNDWLGEPSPASTTLNDFFVNGEACLQVVNGCYTPLAWEYNNTYYSEWYIGDIASDDALKGGQDVADGMDAYDIDNFKTNANNAIILNYYRAKYQGIVRCNVALKYISEYEPDETLTIEEKNRYLGEAHFLRGFYYFQLVRVFGGVPLIHDILDTSDKWLQPRASVNEVYQSIVEDFKFAEENLWNKDEYAEEDMGRATKGAACAMLCKAYLYNHDYENAYIWGKKFKDEHYDTGKYTLCPIYADNFTLIGENGPESVFEMQYMEDPMSDYGEGNGFSRGTFTTILTRPRMSALGSKKGWGFDHPTKNLYNEFESGDPRREATIGIPPISAQSEVEVNYLGSPYYNNKTAFSEGGTFPSLSHDSRAPLNYRLIRASDVLLLYGEAALESGKDPSATKWAIEEVRKRARLESGVAGVLPSFPNYRGYSDNIESLRDALRHERRVELAMEGHRWFDLVRWGIAKQVMDKDTGSYGANESEEAKKEMASFIEGKHELFPIPNEEMALNPMDQNPGY